MISRSAHQRVSKFHNRFNQLKFLTRLETPPKSLLKTNSTNWY